MVAIRRCTALVVCIWMACITLSAAEAIESSSPPKYSVGFELEHKLLTDFARSAEARAQAVGTDFNHVSVVAAKAGEEERARQQAQLAAVNQFNQAQTQRVQARLTQEQRKLRHAEKSKFDLKAKIAAVKAKKAALKAKTANKVAVQATVKAAASSAAAKVAMKAATASKTTPTAATKPAAAASKATARKGKKLKRKVGSKARRAGKKRTLKAKAPVATVSSTPKSLMQTTLLAIESPTLKIPDWPSLNDPANVAADVLVRSRGPNNTIFEQQNAAKQELVTKLPKFTGQQSYAEHFKEWPQATKLDPVQQAKAQARAIQLFKRQKFLGKTTTPAPKLQQKIKQKPTQKKLQAPPTKTVAPKKTIASKTVPTATVTPPVVTPSIQSTPQKTTKTAVPVTTVEEEEEKKKPFPWWYVIGGAVLFVFLCAGLALAFRKKKQQSNGAELDAVPHQV